MNIKDNRFTKIIRLTNHAFGRYKREIITLTILGFFSGVIEGIGINALIPLFSFVSGETVAGTDAISKFITNIFKSFNINLNVGLLLGFIIFMFILKAIATIVIAYIKIKIAADYEKSTRSRLLSKVLRSTWPHLIKQKLGYLETVIMIDITASANLLTQISLAITIVTGLLVYLVIAFNISSIITLITLILGLIFFLIIKPLVYRTKLVSQRRVATMKESAHYVNENILGVKTVKAMMVDNLVIKKADNLFENLRKLWIKSSMLENISTSFVEPLSLIFISAIFAFTYQSPDFNIGVLAAIMYLIHRIFVYIQQLQRIWHKFNNIFPHLEKILSYEKEAVQNVESNPGKTKFDFSDKLEFKGLSFNYSDKRVEVLSGINFSIAKGELVGLIGPSGSGKTTLVDLILRLFNPIKGEILLDGKNINEIDIESWRKNIGYVSQDIFLINDTIANNIRFYNQSLSKQDLEKFAKMANIYDFIQTLPEKFETIIGERGIMISAGQRQRIVIARILARQPKILILDEATSALDNESESQIQKVVDNLKGKITVLAIAHRLSTVKDSDKLIVLQDGKIVEQGSPDELLKNKDSYFFKAYNIRD